MRNQAQNDLNAISGFFDLPGSFVNAIPYGTGHINDTFLIHMGERDSTKRYVLQRVNHNVFKKPTELMGNVKRVTEHVQEKMRRSGRDPDRHSLSLLPAKNGGYWDMDDEGNTWRMYAYIENTVGYDVVDSVDKAFEGGRAFGEFQSMLVDLPGGPLYETIPGFHDIGSRLSAFDNAVSRDSVGRSKFAGEQIAFVQKRADEMMRLIRLAEQGLLPIRTTHNDTKFNNVLLDARTDKAVCVIDLDTVMPGLVHFDFGDSIRTATNTGAEDEQDLTRVEINLDFFSGYTRGYLSFAHAFLTDIELKNLAFSGKLMTFIIGLRFLTDYLENDRYFKIHRAHHNLHRAKAQFKLLQSMEMNFSYMQDIIELEYERCLRI